MAFFDNIHFPYFSFQELNLDWLLKEVKRIAGFMPEGGNVGDILTKKSDGAEWEVPSAVTLDIASLPEDTQILDNDQLIFYDISSQANRKIKPPNLMDSMCSNGTPLMNGTGSAGTSKKPSRYDHVHPTDTSRAPISYFQNSALKIANGGTGANNVNDALVNLGLDKANVYIGPMVQHDNINISTSGVQSTVATELDNPPAVSGYTFATWIARTSTYRYAIIGIAGTSSHAIVYYVGNPTSDFVSAYFYPIYVKN